MCYSLGKWNAKIVSIAAGRKSEAFSTQACPSPEVRGCHGYPIAWRRSPSACVSAYDPGDSATTPLAVARFWEAAPKGISSITSDSHAEVRFSWMLLSQRLSSICRLLGGVCRKDSRLDMQWRSSASVPPTCPPLGEVGLMAAAVPWWGFGGAR